MGTSASRTNVEGLTWEEWAYAAGVEPTTPGYVFAYGYSYPYDPQRELRRAWKAGEDPTDWRKHHADLAHAKYREAST